MNQRRPRVFLCHATGDKARVRLLQNSLERAGVDAWLDERELIGGQDWDLEIRRALRRSDLVLVCLSRDSITKRGYVQKEIRLTLDLADEQPEGEIFVLPVRLEECEMPMRLSRWHAVDFYKEGGAHKILAAISRRCEDMADVATPDIATSVSLGYRLSHLFEHTNDGSREELLHQSVALNGDGRLLATGCGRGGVTVHQLPDGEVVRTVQHVEEDGYVRAVALDETGDVLVTMGRRSWGVPSAILLWSVATGELLSPAVMGGAGPWVFAQMRASRNAEMFVTINQSDTLKLWDIARQVCREGAEGVMGGEAISRDGMRFAYSSKSDCTISDFSTGNSVAVINTRPRGPLALSSTGKLIAIACTEEIVEIWEVFSDRSRLVCRIETPADATDLCFANEDACLISSHNGGSVCIWHTGDGALLARLKGLKGAVVAVSASDDSRVVAAASLNGDVAVWTAR
jgi:TIR domain